MSATTPDSPPARKTGTAARFLPVLAGVSLFFAFQYGVALWRLSSQSGGMMNKFSALAREQYLGFLVGENLRMLPAYLLLALIGAILAQPAAAFWTKRSKRRGTIAVILRATAITALLHGYCMLRLVDTRPYFLNDAAFGHWYYRVLDIIPVAAKPATHLVLFVILPVLAILAAIVWQIHRHRRRGWIAAGGALALLTLSIALRPANLGAQTTPHEAGRPYNVIIIGSDSLRADKLGAAGYRPSRGDAAGVSPVIDALAARSIRFEHCYTPIASTLESGTSLMTANYPHTHGFRQMYPDRDTVAAAKEKTIPLAALLRARGYDTAAIGDWCAGYYELMPLGFEHVSVSSFDNFKIYMSQAVVMAHFVIPLYFDNPLGYRMFPQLGSFAQFVTPEVVTQRVENRLTEVAENDRPFFWHVFYSCNHLPYRSAEPFNSMFTDPAYQGRNKTGVDFDIDAFIGGTDLESKWKALPPHEVEQIRALYDGCTRQFDDCVDRIVKALERNGLADNTIVIITADHGDDLYEPGVTLGHGLTFNGGLQANHVPLIVHIPGKEARVIPETVRLIDVIPTIADLTGVEKPAVWEGRSFAGWLKGTEEPEWRPFYGETGFPFIQFTVPGVERPKLPPMDELTAIEEDFNYQFVVKEEYRGAIVRAKQRCLRTRHWKLVCTPAEDGSRHFALFHLPSDPHGATDVADKHPEVLLPMKSALERWMDGQGESTIGDMFPDGEPG